jgi:hypothetical protein
MLDYKKLRKETSKLIQSFTAEELQEWLDMDRKRMALAEMEEENSHIAVVKPQRINGTSPKTAKSRKVSARQRKEVVI